MFDYKVERVIYLQLMRIERTGQVDPLTPRVIAFLTQALGGISLDETHSAEACRIDYSCLRGLLAVELKTLEEPGNERLDNLADALSQRDDWPLFLGSAPIRSFIENTDDPEELSRQVIDRVGRAIINHLKKANRQLEAHAVTFPRRNMVRLLVLVNEDHEIYDPHTVSYILWHALRRKNGERQLYEHVDAILYLTQRHAILKDGLVTFPVLTIDGRGVYEQNWKAELLRLVSQRWAQWNGIPDIAVDASVDQFSTIEHIPELASRSERWRTEYRRDPYLRRHSFDKLRDVFDENIVMTELSFLKNSPLTLSMEQKMVVIRQFGDLIQEMGERGFPITKFPAEPLRHAAAAKRLDLPPHVIDWFESLARKSS